MRFSALALLATLGSGIPACPPASSPAAVLIPFRDAGGLIVLDVRVNEAPARPFVLDTGARPCLLDEAVARTLGVTARDSASLGGGAGTFVAGVASPLPRVRLAGADLRAECDEVILSDLAGISRDVGAWVDGILGGDFFRDRVVVVDYGAHRLELHPALGFQYEGRGDTVPITIERKRPWLVATLIVPGGSPTERELLIDTGSDDAVDDSLLLQSTERLSGARRRGWVPASHCDWDVSRASPSAAAPSMTCRVPFLRSRSWVMASFVASAALCSITPPGAYTWNGRYS